MLIFLYIKMKQNSMYLMLNCINYMCYVMGKVTMAT